MNWGAWQLLERSNGDEVFTQPDAAAFLGNCVLAGLGAAVVASITSSPRTRAWRHNFSKTVLLIVLIVQYVHVAKMAMVLPPNITDTELVILTKCRRSTKGGKPHGSFRDCTKMQGAYCSKNEPCSPCDAPVSPFEFDGTLHSTHCEECSTSYLGKCQFVSGVGVDREYTNKHGPFCRRLDGVVEPCVLCCASSQVASNRILQLLQYDNCAAVYELADSVWPDHPKDMYGCVDTAFPVATRYGCCPAEAARPIIDATDEISEVLSSRGGDSAQLYLAPCMSAGPMGASWAYCEGQAAIEASSVTDSAALLQGHTLELVGGIGCSVYSNGIYMSQYCREPLLLNSTAAAAPSLNP